MNFSFSKPLYLLLLIFVPPVIIFLLKSIKKVNGIFSFFDKKKSPLARIKMRVFCWSIAYSFVILALAHPSFGLKPKAVYKNGNSISFVFDISLSMMAKDVRNYPSLTRLEAASSYAKNILPSLKGTAISVVLAKGDGIVAVPLTEDYYAVESLLQTLSPYLISAPGSSIGKGIKTASASFLPQEARESLIVVFTDGDETDKTLLTAVKEVIGYGIKVIFVGFGDTQPTPILSGDGKTEVETSLREDHLKKIAMIADSVRYVNAFEKGSAYAVLEGIVPFSQERRNAIITSKMVPIPRYRACLCIALFFIVLGFFIGECNFLKVSKKTMFLLLCCCTPFLYSGCTQSLKNSMNILNGSFHWQRMNYDKATVIFLDVIETSKKDNDEVLLQYGLGGLASTYIMQNEYTSAQSRIEEIALDAPKEVLFRAYYNAGIIAYRNAQFDVSAQLFGQSLRIDGENKNAKINYELAISKRDTTVSQSQQEITAVSEKKNSSALEDTVFSVIKENEEQRWKNMQKKSTVTDQIDY